MNLWQMDTGQEGWINPRALYVYKHTGRLLMDGSYVTHECKQGIATLRVIRQPQSVAIHVMDLQPGLEIAKRHMLSQLILPVDVW